MGKLFYGLYCLGLIILGFFLSELFLRFRGDRPFNPVGFSITVEPGGKLYQPHAQLGYTHIPGPFKVTLPDGYHFKVTHLSNHRRATESGQHGKQSPGKPALWIFGCSITYGWAINDQETFPWLLQERFPQINIDNYGVSGYGTVHAYWQLQEELQTQPKPLAVIITYGSFHDTRNVCSRHYRKAIITHAALGNLKFPAARFDPQNRLIYVQVPSVYREFPFMRYSAFIHRLEESYNRRERDALRYHEVTQAIMADIIKLCQQHEIPVIVAGVKDDSVTYNMLAFAREQGGYAVDIAVDLKKKEYTNYPHDSHPSAQAHREYAFKLETFLRKSGLTDLTKNGRP